MTTLLHSHRFKCKWKVKFTMEEAAVIVGQRDESLVLFICSHCHFVHFGHDRRNWSKK